MPSALEAVILKCLTKKAELRYQTMAELIDDLEAVESGLTPKAVVDHVARSSHSGPDLFGSRRAGARHVRARPAADQRRHPGRRGKLPLLIGAGVLVALAGAGFALMPSGEVADQNVVKPADGQPPQPAPLPAQAPSPTPVAEAQPDPKPPEPAPPAEVTIKSEPRARSCIATAR